MLEDTRMKGKITYKIWDIVVVTILAVLADCNDWEEIEDFAKDEKDFLKKILKLTGGIPCAKTYERVISTINSEELNSMFLNFVKAVQYAESINFKDILSFDGKVERGSGRNKGIKREEVCPLNVLNVIDYKCVLTKK